MNVAHFKLSESTKTTPRRFFSMAILCWQVFFWEKERVCQVNKREGRVEKLEAKTEGKFLHFSDSVLGRSLNSDRLQWIAKCANAAGLLLHFFALFMQKEIHHPLLTVTWTRCLNAFACSVFRLLSSPQVMDDSGIIEWLRLQWSPKCSLRTPDATSQKRNDIHWLRFKKQTGCTSMMPHLAPFHWNPYARRYRYRS